MGRFWARCKLGSESKTQVHHSCDEPGIVGCCHLSHDLNRPALRTQSPEQGGGCRCLPNLPDSSWFSRYQLMSAPGCHLLQESLRLVPLRCDGMLWLLLDLPVRQPPLGSSLRRCPRVGVHTRLHSPRAGGATPPASAPPQPPLSSSHSSRHARRVAAHIVVSPSPVRMAVRYTARSPPVACAASYLRFC